MSGLSFKSAVFSISIVCFLGGSAVATASSISFVNQFKNVGFLQTGNGNTLTGNGDFYSADLNATVANAYTSVC